MPDTAAQMQPMSRTEIAMRIKAIIADTLSVGVCEVREGRFIHLIGVGAFQTPRSLAWVEVIVDQIERAFHLRLEDAHTTTFRGTATVGDLISLVEGALSEGGIA